MPDVNRVSDHHIQNGDAAISTEVELKLSARPPDLPRLKHALLEIAPGGVSAQQKLTSTYYDTPEQVLKKRALTLRIREQAGRFVQNVKAGDGSGAQLLSRGEWEDAVDGNHPEPEAPQSGPQLPEGIGEELNPLFITEVIRTTAEIEPAPGTRIEVAIDEGEIRAIGSETSESISEIELELKSGDAAALYDIAERLIETAPIRIGMRSKSERGYGLLDGAATAARAVHAQPVALDPEMTIDAALREIGRNCLTQLLRNEAAALARQPEGIHQMRVAVRRLRSAVSSFKTIVSPEDRHWVDEELGWLGRALGPARNLDVFATELLQAACAGLPDQSACDELAATLDRLRRTAYDGVRDAVLSERYTITMLRLLRWFEVRGWRENALPTPLIGKLAPRVLDRRHRKVRQRGKKFGRLTPPERHKLRIAAKKLRYTIELLGGLFDKGDLQKYAKRLKSLQDDLGYANDVRVAHDFLAELFAEIDPRGPGAHAWIGVLEWHDQRLAGRERKLRKHLDRLNRAPAFWRN